MLKYFCNKFEIHAINCKYIAGLYTSLLKRSNIDWMIRQWNFEWDQYDDSPEDQMFLSKHMNLLKYVKTGATKQWPKSYNLSLGMDPLDTTSDTGTHLTGTQTVDSVLRQKKMLSKGTFDSSTGIPALNWIHARSESGLTEVTGLEESSQATSSHSGQTKEKEISCKGQTVEKLKYPPGQATPH